MSNPPIRIMLVDDSTIIRALLREVLGAEKDLEVVAFAGNGKLALPRLRFHKPDFVILDYEMPEMNGLETLEHIVRDHPEIKVIMFSTHTVDGAKVTLKALDIGALDFLPKPSTVRAEDPREYIRENLAPRIRALHTSGQALTHRPGAERSSSAAAEAHVPPTPVDEAGRAGQFDLCAIGVSTGGPVALKQLFSSMPVLDGSILITQHMPPLFTAQLAETLDRVSPMKVVEAEEGMKITRGNAYVAPGDRHMIVKRQAERLFIHLDDSPAYMHCKPSVNLMFNSLVDLMPKRTLTVIMTGMGNDGNEGIVKLHQHGSTILGQNRESCVVFGMPAAPTRDGLVRESLDIQGLAARITLLLGPKP